MHKRRRRWRHRAELRQPQYHCVYGTGRSRDPEALRLQTGATVGSQRTLAAVMLTPGFERLIHQHGRDCTVQVLAPM
jgi:hypothetical protein